jgi:hypothetical protein
MTLPRVWPVRIAAGVALVFGCLTLRSGGLVLFGGAAPRAAAGNAVPVVVWFNFLSGFAYVLAGLGIAARRRWAWHLSVALAVSIAVVFAIFGVHMMQGGAFEIRTVAAMTLRLGVWVAIALTLRRGSTPG